MGAKKWVKAGATNPLTELEREFCRLYLFGEDGTRGNGSECYRRLYLRPKNKTMNDGMVWAMAYRMMKKREIHETIQEWQSQVITPEWVKSQLEQIAVKKLAKDSDRVRAIELLGKTQGIFIDKVENNVKFDGLFLEEEEKTKDTTP